jgi:glycosyltransferase involved in cell wall biosynthesis
MGAVQELQKRCPKAHIVIVGGDEVSYSPKPPAGTTYREMALKEQKGKIDFSRVHMMGQLPYADYLSLLQVSSAHVYLTYPFVLSWSLIESLAAGCLVIGSKTAPVEEAIVDGENGLLVDFFSPQAIAEKVADALRRQDELRPLREKARQTAIERYDLKRVCLPAQAALVEKLAEVRPKAPAPQPG